MLESTYRFGLFTLYQFALAVGILMMPIALAARQAGVSLPVGEFVDDLGAAYERAAQ